MKQSLLKMYYKILRFFTRIYIWRHKPYIMGITGSVGKTSCRMTLYYVLSQLHKEKKIYTSPQNYNSEIGMILAFFCIEKYNPSIKSLLIVGGDIIKQSLLGKKQYDIFLAEYGIDSPGDMDFLLSIARPDIAILTKLDSVHSENFPGGVTQLWGEKFKMLLGAKERVYYNSQDSFLKEHNHLLGVKNSQIFSTKISSTIKKREDQYIREFFYKKKKISLNMLAGESIEYTQLGLDIFEEGGGKLTQDYYMFEGEHQPGRMTIFEHQNNILIDSSYNAGPASVKQMIGFTKELQNTLFQKHKIIYVLGDMRELGDQTQGEHEQLAHVVGNADLICSIGPHMYTHFIPKLGSVGFAGESYSSLSAIATGKYLKKYLQAHKENKYIVLFKGSQNTIFVEEALSVLLSPTQKKLLPRQSESWHNKKNEFFQQFS